MKSLCRALGITSVLMLIATCGGGSSSPGVPPAEQIPPLVWDQGNWDEVDWQ